MLIEFVIGRHLDLNLSLFLYVFIGWDFTVLRGGLMVLGEVLVRYDRRVTEGNWAVFIYFRGIFSELLHSMFHCYLIDGTNFLRAGFRMFTLIF